MTNPVLDLKAVEALADELYLGGDLRPEAKRAINALLALLRETRAALEPFGAHGLSEIADDTILTVMWEERLSVFRGIAAVTMGALRRAAAVLAKATEGPQP